MITLPNGKQLVIGYCYLVADILHFGHKLHLRNCRRNCDVLIAGVLSEKAVLEKKKAPIIPLHSRIESVEDLKIADIVCAQDDYSPLENCKAYKPDILFESASHKEMPANNFIKSIGGSVMVMGYYPDESSSQIKERIKEQ